jgi:hypothetical protein
MNLLHPIRARTIILAWALFWVLVAGVVRWAL